MSNQVKSEKVITIAELTYMAYFFFMFGARASGLYEGKMIYNITIVAGMLLFGTNFNLFYFILIKKAKEAFKSEELRWYIIIVALATLAIAVNILDQYENISVALILREMAMRNF